MIYYKMKLHLQWCGNGTVVGDTQYNAGDTQNCMQANKGRQPNYPKSGEGKMYNTRKHTTLFTIHLQTLEVAKPTTP